MLSWLEYTRREREKEEGKLSHFKFIGRHKSGQEKKIKKIKTKTHINLFNKKTKVI
jgi:hypothetical protein